ncbi:hypothetical protein FRC18_007862 [Serendipita sp. 400]|nr:hypothetical protein FRC18_007862 [Serendipita sp. 400]
MQSRSSINSPTFSSKTTSYTASNARQSPMTVEMHSPISPITPSTPPYQIGKASGLRRMSVERGHDTSQNATQPRSHVDDGVNEDEDEDQKMLNRFSIDSTASTLLGESEEGDDSAPWTEDQLAILNRHFVSRMPFDSTANANNIYSIRRLKKANLQVQADRSLQELLTFYRTSQRTSWRSGLVKLSIQNCGLIASKQRGGC